MSTSSLSADCDRCAALCCFALAFDRSPSFALDKDAGVPCPHLDEDRCAIHAERAARGFGGCIHYDCHGAGQRVTQQTFGGAHWRDGEETARDMLAAFFVVRGLHELLLLVTAALQLPAAAPLRAELEERRRALDDDAGLSRAQIVDVDLVAHRHETHELLRRIGPLHRRGRLVVLAHQGDAGPGERACARVRTR